MLLPDLDQFSARVSEKFNTLYKSNHVPNDDYLALAIAMASAYQDLLDELQEETRNV